MADDKVKLRDLIARQLDGDPATNDTRQVTVEFRSSGDKVDVTLRRLTPSEQRRAQAYAAFDSHGEGTGEFVYRLGIAAIRFGAVDDEGQHHFTSFDQVVDLQNVVTDDSWDALAGALAELRRTDEGVDSAKDPEAGKGS